MVACRRDARPVASRSCVRPHSAGPQDRARPADAARTVRTAHPSERATHSAPSANQKHSLPSLAASLRSNTDPSNMTLRYVNSTVALARHGVKASARPDQHFDPRHPRSRGDDRQQEASFWRLLAREGGDPPKTPDRPQAGSTPEPGASRAGEALL